MLHNRLPCAAGNLAPDALAALNRSPLAFLANCGVRHGASFGPAFVHAQLLVDRHDSGRRLDGDDARKLCLAVRTWAEHLLPSS